MDANTLVMEQIDEGERLLLKLNGEGLTVRAASWVKPTEEDRWTLFISAPLVDAKGSTAAYRDVYRVLRTLGGGWVNDSDIKLIGENHPVAREMIDLLHRHPGRSPVRSRRTMLGGMPVDEIYLYPRMAERSQTTPEDRRLKRDVEQIMRPQDAMLTDEERAVRRQLVSSGVCMEDADKWVRQNRKHPAQRPPIPAGTVVKTWVAAHWGEKANDDPDLLLIVEAPDGARGLIMKRNTDPV
jgi:hypothetical protein